MKQELFDGQVAVETPEEDKHVREPRLSRWERLMRKMERPKVVVSKVYEEQDGRLSPDYGLENFYAGIHNSHWGEVDIKEFRLFGVFYRRIETLRDTLRQTEPAIFDHNDLNGGIVLGSDGFKINQ